MRRYKAGLKSSKHFNCTVGGLAVRVVPPADSTGRGLPVGGDAPATFKLGTDWFCFNLMNPRTLFRNLLIVALASPRG